MGETMDAFTDIQLFATIVKLGSMAAAAQELGVTPPVVTRRLAGLEKRLGVRLLNRSTRKISLTADGEVYLVEGERLLESLRALEARMGEGRGQPQGSVRIAATLGFGRTYIAPVLSAFSLQYPQVALQLHLSDRPIHLVEQGFDLAVRFGTPSDSRLTARLLARNRRLLCASPRYLQRWGEPSHPRELGQHNCIFIREGDDTFGTWHFASGSDQVSVKVRSTLSTNDGASALQWALDGHGILLRSEWEVAQSIHAGQLVRLLPQWRPPDADIHLIFQSMQPMPAKIRVLVDALLRRFEDQRKPARDRSRPWLAAAR